MKKLIAAFAASACLMGSQAASAHTGPYISPAAPWTFSGTLAVSKGLSLTCNVTVVLSGPNNAGDGVATSHTDFSNITATTTISAGNFLCPTVVPEVVGPGDVQYDPATNTVKIVDFFVDTITPGDCRGDLEIEWDGAGLIFDNESLPQDTSGGPCGMDGYLALQSPTGGTINP